MKMKATKFQTSAPFGVATKRFAGIGFHPGLDPTGSMMKNKSKLGPGSYDAENFQCAYKKYNIGGSSWKRKLDVEEWSKNLGYRNAHILKERHFQGSLRGPGTYEVSEYVYKRQTSCCKHNVGFGSGERFRDPIKQTSPAPGSYGKSATEATITGHRQFTNIPSFEWDGFIDRFRGRAPSWTLPPNRYDPKDTGSINALLSKVVSKRGPYDCFTGPRDGTTIKNHFAPSSFKGPLNWFRTWPSQLDNLLNHANYRRYGKFLKEPRFGKPTLRHMLNDLCLCGRDPNEPSPCTYETNIKKEANQNKYPFNMSVLEARVGIKWKIYPGVGRYSPQPPVCSYKSKYQRESWPFKSKTKRSEIKAPDYTAF